MTDTPPRWTWSHHCLEWSRYFAHGVEFFTSTQLWWKCRAAVTLGARRLRYVLCWTATSRTCVITPAVHLVRHFPCQELLLFFFITELLEWWILCHYKCIMSDLFLKTSNSLKLHQIFLGGCGGATIGVRLTVTWTLILMIYCPGAVLPGWWSFTFFLIL